MMGNLFSSGDPASTQRVSHVLVTGPKEPTSSRPFMVSCPQQRKTLRDVLALQAEKTGLASLTQALLQAALDLQLRPALRPLTRSCVSSSSLTRCSPAGGAPSGPGRAGAEPRVARSLPPGHTHRQPGPRMPLPCLCALPRRRTPLGGAVPAVIGKPALQACDSSEQLLPPALAMGLRESPFHSHFLGGLNALARGLLYPSYWLVSQLLALQQTTAEKQVHRGQSCQPPHALHVLATGPLLLLLLVLSMPFCLLGLLLWLPLQTARRPFAYRHTPSQASPEEWVLPGKGKAFQFVSSNICLLPDGLAKFSNLADTQRRAVHIAQALIHTAGCTVPSREVSTGGSVRNGSRVQEYGATESSPPRPCQRSRGSDIDVTIEVPLLEGKAAWPQEILTSFPPDMDFLCLQEVFDWHAAAHLLQILAPHYEHIIYDVGSYGLLGCSALKLLNSGLFLASRYPLLAVQYHCYPNGSGEDAFAAKGLLCVQVQLGVSQGQRIVGYMNCTHLHAPERDAQVRCEQLTLALRWTQQFQDTHRQSGDIVAFDIFSGDLNFDNCSPDDKIEQAHEIFTIYTDPCRIGPGQDKPWALGTLMNYLELYDEAVATPEAMKRMLESAEGRRKYLAGPILEKECHGVSPNRSEGRRIDYILYREHHGLTPLKTTVERVSYITQLAGCSDHIPVGLRLLVSPVAQPGA